MQDHLIIPTTENGLDLIVHAHEPSYLGAPMIKRHDAQTMTDEEIATFLHHSKISTIENMIAAMSEAEILKKLDSTK